MRWRLRRFFYTLLVLAVIVLVAFLMLRSRYREIVTELAETQVKNATSDLTNDAIARQIANGTIQYDFSTSGRSTGRSLSGTGTVPQCGQCTTGMGSPQ